MLEPPGPCPPSHSCSAKLRELRALINPGPDRHNAIAVASHPPQSQLVVMLPFEPTRRPPTRTNSAEERFLRATRQSVVASATPTEEHEFPTVMVPTSDVTEIIIDVKPNPLLSVILPFEPTRRPPTRANSAEERFLRATGKPPMSFMTLVVKDESCETLDTDIQINSSEMACLLISTDFPVDINSPHILFQLGKYYDALQIYQEVLDQRNCLEDDEPYDEVTADDFIDFAVHAAKCCYQLRLYAQADYYCQLAFDRIERETDASRWGLQHIHCTILKAKALGRMHKTKDSLQLLRDCRALIRQYTSYKTVKEYLKENESLGFPTSGSAEIVAQE